MTDKNDTIGLAEAAQLVKENKLNDPRLREFTNRINEAATDVLSPMDDDYLKSAIGVCTATGLAHISTDDEGNPNFDGLMTAIKLSQDENFMSIAILIFKMAVGLAITEEWR